MRCQLTETTLDEPKAYIKLETIPRRSGVNDYVIKQMVNGSACTIELWCTWEFAKPPLKKLKSLSAIASSDSYASLVLSNLPRVP